MMESFLNKVEREANEEVKRIHREAQQVVAVLNALELAIPKELQEIAYPLIRVPSVSIKEAVTTLENLTEDLEPKRKKQDHSKRIANAKAKAEAEHEQTRTEIYSVLRKGPKLTEEVYEQIPRSKYRIKKTASRMKRNGELDFRIRGYQGPTEWFLIERPVTLEQLRDEVVDRKGGDIPLQETQEKLGFRDLQDLYRMLDELVEQGIIRRTENDTYENYNTQRSLIPLDTRTHHEKKKYTMRSGVAGTGRIKETSNHDVKGMLDKVKSQGAKVKLTGSGHIQIEHDGKKITIGKSPSRSGILQDKNRVKQVLGLNV